ncbi:hypothetical protein CARUB_v10010449mg [Capsella rubella]|uniref:Uncharacterized protein n=1 Tax=Capsella rubella TaxID=81985 RepID=R0IJL7_9BRAS|nr:uncharacterized protein LOC17899389 [Capsella rubella]EOA37143.1 hypothetical protein CARUB_v10010449mg [Capsella rubella]
MKQNQNKFLRIISTPLRALGKARDFYVRSITGCAARTHYSSSASVSAPFPRSRSSSSAAFSSSASSRRTTDFGIDDDYSELVRAASVRSLGHKSEIDMLIQEKLQQQRQAGGGGGGGGLLLPKSSSVGMARIEEEEETEEGSVNPKMKKKTKKVSDLLYPRSKSYAVTTSGSLQL